MGIDVTLAGMVLLQMILSPEKPSISATTAGISIAAGYFSFQWLFEVGIRQGQVDWWLLPDSYRSVKPAAAEVSRPGIQ